MRTNLVQKAMESGEIKVTKGRSKESVPYEKISRKKGSGFQLNRYNIHILGRVLEAYLLDSELKIYLFNSPAGRGKPLDMKKKDSERDILRKAYQIVRRY